MHLSIDGDDLMRAAGDPTAKRIIRSAAYFLLASIGDISEETESVECNADGSFTIVPTGTSGTPSAPSVAPAATATAANYAGAPGVGISTTSPVSPSPTGPGLASNVLPFPPPPPPPPMDAGHECDDADEGTNTGKVPPPPQSSTVSTVVTSQTTATPYTLDTLPAANTAAAVVGVASVPTLPVSVEADSAGMPYDERIHQKSKNKKKNGEWKLIKGIEEKSPGLVQSVTAELAARRGSLPPTSTPTGANTVPLPPLPNAAPVNGVPAPNGVGVPVPVPSPPSVGPMGASPYRALIDKITDLTKAQKLAPSKVAGICQAHGAPSLMALNNMQHLIPGIDKDIDAAALGLM